MSANALTVAGLGVSTPVVYANAADDLGMITIPRVCARSAAALGEELRECEPSYLFHTAVSSC